MSSARRRSQSAVAWAAPVAVMALLLVPVRLALAAPAAAGFEPAQVIELVKREVIAADRGRESRADGLRIEEVQVELDLMEVAGKGGGRLVVPAADFAPGRGQGTDGARKAAPKRRLVVDLAPPAPSTRVDGAGRGPDAAPDVGEPSAPASGTGGMSPATGPGAAGVVSMDVEGAALPTTGPLARAIADLRDGLREAVDAAPRWEAKRIGIDLDFAVERDAHGAPVLVVFTGGRSVDARDLHRLKLRLATRDPEPARAASRSSAVR